MVCVCIRVASIKFYAESHGIEGINKNLADVKRYTNRKIMENLTYVSKCCLLAGV